MSHTEFSELDPTQQDLPDYMQPGSGEDENVAPGGFESLDAEINE